jgi:hypothetical protein
MLLGNAELRENVLSLLSFSYFTSTHRLISLYIYLLLLYFLFCTQSGVKRPQRSFFHRSIHGRYKLQQGPLASLALTNLLFEVRTSHFTHSTLQIQQKTRSSHVPLPPVTSELQTSPPSSKSRMLASSSPAKRSSCWLPEEDRGRTTWPSIGDDLQQMNTMASDTEVGEGSPYRPRITATNLIAVYCT